jgi:hypothetical protein
LATTEDIKKFLELAGTTPEGKNLETLWRRAHGEGYEKGRKSLLRSLEMKLEERFEEGIDRGMNLGREEGYTVAKGGFDHLLAQIKAREDSKRPSTIDFSTQTSYRDATFEITKTRTNLSVATQTDSPRGHRHQNAGPVPGWLVPPLPR